MLILGLRLISHWYEADIYLPIEIGRKHEHTWFYIFYLGSLPGWHQYRAGIVSSHASLVEYFI